jgi:hypothetical protein
MAVRGDIAGDCRGPGYPDRVRANMPVVEHHGPLPTLFVDRTGLLEAQARLDPDHQTTPPN